MSSPLTTPVTPLREPAGAVAPFPCPDGGALALARAEVDQYLAQLRGADTSGADPGTRRLRAEMIERFGMRATQAIVLIYLVEQQHLQAFTSALGPERTAAILVEMRNAAAELITSEVDG